MHVIVMVLIALLSASAATASIGPTAGRLGDANAASVASANATSPCAPGGACPLDEEGTSPEPAKPTPERTKAERVSLLFFWGEGCPHCEQAKPFLDKLAKSRQRLVVERIEVRKNRDGRKRFVETMKRLGAQAVGIPTFVVNNDYAVGFLAGTTEQQVTALVDAALGDDDRGATTPDTAVAVPWLGQLDATTLSLPVFTLAVGLVDGINPCAMWVLLVLLGVLAHVRSTKRLFMVGGTFVVMSGVVYFAFMTAWLGLFELVGLSRTITVVLGAAVFVMGLINLKELVWFKKGVSLTIPDKVKPKLYKRMRGVANAVSVPAAFLGVATLAFFVNLIELACTLGLPAVFTRVLSLREQLSTFERYGYLVLYNLAYIVPLALIVVVYALTLHRMTLSERGAKALKGVSGVLLVTFGALFMLAPGVLGG